MVQAAQTYTEHILLRYVTRVVCQNSVGAGILQLVW
jgi:hypothetical protein